MSFNTSEYSENQRMEREKVNFYHFICLMAEVGGEVLRCRLKQSYKNSHVQTLSSFLNDIDILHTIFHLCLPAHLCCWRGCKTQRSNELSKTFKKQWHILYDFEPARCCQQNRRDPNKVCMCCVTSKNVTESDLDLSLLCFILNNCCNLMPNEREAVQKIREMKNDSFSHNSKFMLSNLDFENLWDKFGYYIKHLDNTNIYLKRHENILHRPMDESLMQKYFLYCLESTNMEHLESEIKDVHSSVSRVNEKVEAIADILQKGLIELRSSIEYHRQDDEVHCVTTKRKRLESTPCFDVSNEQDNTDCISTKRKFQKLTKFINVYRGNTDGCTFKQADTRPVDMSGADDRNCIHGHPKMSDEKLGFKGKDKFICGKCSWLFVSLDQFMQHKGECILISHKDNEVIKTEYKKYIVSRITLPIKDQDVSYNMVKGWQQGEFNPKHNSIEVTYMNIGSVVMWIKVDVLLFLDIKQFYSEIDFLVNSLFQKYAVEMPLYRVEVFDIVTGYVDHINDEFCCGDCELKCDTLDEFISHKNTKCSQDFWTKNGKSLKMDTQFNKTGCKSKELPCNIVTLKSRNLYNTSSGNCNNIQKKRTQIRKTTDANMTKGKLPMAQNDKHRPDIERESSALMVPVALHNYLPSSGYIIEGDTNLQIHYSENDLEDSKTYFDNSNVTCFNEKEKMNIAEYVKNLRDAKVRKQIAKCLRTDKPDDNLDIENIEHYLLVAKKSNLKNTLKCCENTLISNLDARNCVAYYQIAEEYELSTLKAKAMANINKSEKPYECSYFAIKHNKSSNKRTTDCNNQSENPTRVLENSPRTQIYNEYYSLFTYGTSGSKRTITTVVYDTSMRIRCYRDIQKGYKISKLFQCCCIQGDENDPPTVYWSFGSSVHQYDPLMNKCKKRAAINYKRANFNLVSHGNQCYVIGGVYKGRKVLEIEEYNTRKDSWEKVAYLPEDAFPINPSCVVCNDLIYIFSAILDMERNIKPRATAVYIFHPITKKVEKLAEIPWSFYQMKTCVVGSFIYIASDKKHFIRFCPSQGSYLSLPEQMQEYKDFGMFTKERSIVLAGGYFRDRKCKDIHVFCTDSGNWETLSETLPDSMPIYGVCKLKIPNTAGTIVPFYETNLFEKR